MKRYAIFLILLFPFTLGWRLMVGSQDSDSMQMKVRGVTVDKTSGQPVVVLVDMNDKRALPIWIGATEARAIAMELEGIASPRPLTHDLIMNIIKGFRAKLNKVIITEIKDNTFYALLKLEINGSELSIDSRPSDAIALALKVNAPIFVAKKVVEQAQTIELTNNLPKEVSEEKYGFNVQELTKELSECFDLKNVEGVLVAEVREGSPSEKGGLRKGDVIEKIGKERVRGIEDFQKAFEKVKLGRVRLLVIREGKELSLDLQP